MTPGVILNDSVNPDPARYRTIRDAIARDHNQVVILGASLLGSFTDTHLETNEKAKEIEEFRNRVISAAIQSWVATICTVHIEL